ncbi:LacI family DNA-binding transcriptional regulator [bacterium]
MKQKKVTIKNIAQKMDVTPATISKALRDSTDISDETKRRVKQLAEEMGYQPNIMARSLASRKSNLLGVIVPNLTISFYSEAVRGIYEQARSQGYETIIVVNDEKHENEMKNLDFLYALHVDGVLINAVPGQENNTRLINMMKHGIHMVTYDRTVDGLDLSSVTIDDENAAYQVMQYFVGKGKQQVVYLGPTTTPSVARGRYQGYSNAIRDLGLKYNPELVIPCEDNDEDAYAKMKIALQKGAVPDAILCIGGLVAYGGGKAILESGLRIPDDILLAEFGDNSIVHRLGVPFLTVNQSPYKMGCQCVALVVEQINNKMHQQPNKHIIIETKLIEYQRDSRGTVIRGIDIE